MIDVTCQQCSAVYHSEETYIGKQLRCVRCGCLVPILDKAERTVVRQSPAFPDAASRQAQTPSSKHHARRFRRFWFAIATTVVAVAAVYLLLLRHPNAPKYGTANVSDIEEPAQSQKNQKVDNTIDFQPEAPLITSRDATTDGHTPTQPAETRPTNYNSLPTGTRIEEDIGTNGRGTLTVKNGTSEDAWVRLSGSGPDPDQIVQRSFFVKAGTSAHVGRIPQGSYSVTFTTGLNWVESIR